MTEEMLVQEKDQDWLNGGAEKSSGSRRNTLGMGALELFSLGSGIYEDKNNIDNTNNKDKEIILEHKTELSDLKEMLNRLDGFSSDLLESKAFNRRKKVLKEPDQILIKINDMDNKKDEN